MGESNSKQQKDANFNRLPGLVKEWDKSNQKTIIFIKRKLYQSSVLGNNKSNINDQNQYFLLNNQGKKDFKVRTDDNNMIKNYLNNIFIDDNKRERLLHKNEDFYDNQDESQSTQHNMMQNQQQQYDKEGQASNDYSINELDDEQTSALEMNINTYQDQIDDIKALRKKRKSGAKTELDFCIVMSNPINSPTQRNSRLEQNREQLKEYLKRSSIVEEDDREDQERQKFRQIYKSNVKSITSYNVKDIEQQRTESFRENLDNSEFKKYMQQMSKKKAKQLSITQKLMNRKDMFLNNNKNMKKYGRLTKKEVNKLQKEDLNIRKIELQQNAQESKKNFDNDNFLKITRDQMMTNTQMNRLVVTQAQCYSFYMFLKILNMMRNQLQRRKELMEEMSKQEKVTGNPYCLSLFYYLLSSRRRSGLYSLKSINRLESQFVSLCDYNLFVSAELYTQYYMAVREINNPIYSTQQSMPGKHFNRFKGGNEIEQHQEAQTVQQPRFKKLDSTYTQGVVQGQEDFFGSDTRKSEYNKQQINTLGDTNKQRSLPVLVLQNSGGTRGPQYPAIQMNVSIFKNDAEKIIEETIEERRRESQNSLGNSNGFLPRSSGSGSKSNSLKINNKHIHNLHNHLGSNDPYLKLHSKVDRNRFLSHEVDIIQEEDETTPTPIHHINQRS
eukprot:403346194